MVQFNHLDETLPIGVFDSGVGGLTVARAIRDQLPNESIIYVADTKNTPYGPKPIADVRRFALAALDGLVAQGVKMLVIACNTASAAILRDAYERYDVPVVEVIAPTVKSATAITRNGKIGLIGTQGTIKSRVYEEMFDMRPEIKVTSAACPKFVEFVEAGKTVGDEVIEVARGYLDSLINADVDTLVLGCTHYPFLRGALKQVMGSEVALVSSDIETAQRVYEVLSKHDLMRPEGLGEPQVRYETTGQDTAHFVRLAKSMLGLGIADVERLETGVIELP